MISVGGSSSRRRTSPISHPTASPTATPPTAATTNSMPASGQRDAALDRRHHRHPVGHQGGGVVDQALALDQVDDPPAAPPSRRMIAVAATGSVGETIAPRAKAIGHGSPSTACPATATSDGGEQHEPDRR